MIIVIFASRFLLHNFLLIYVSLLFEAKNHACIRNINLQLKSPMSKIVLINGTDSPIEVMRLIVVLARSRGKVGYYVKTQ